MLFSKNFCHLWTVIRGCCIINTSVAPEHARARKMPVRSQFLMIEHARCSNFHFWACSSPLDARFFHTRCNTAFENRQILAKIVHFWSNARAKARSCRIFQCSSMLEPEFGFSSMLEPARYSNVYFRACSSPLDARLFHTRCNTTITIIQGASTKCNAY